ncbi:hypothetical protein X975_10533, partial [Stegodyphus mimosarum]
MMCEHGVGPCSSAFLTVVLLVLSVVMATGQVRMNDNGCLQEGGICTLRTSCPKDSTVNKTALCQQENVDAVCCLSVPRDLRTCPQHGGRCGQEEECRNVQSFGQLDCNEGSRCCLLIY